MEEIEIRKVEVDGETDWHWIKQDQGAFQGPAEDWVRDYKQIHENEVPKRGTIITAGANCGMYARFYSKLYDHVYAFEPEYACFHCLTLNAPTPNVYKMQAFLGERNQVMGIQRVHPQATNWGIHTASNRDQVNKIPMLAIDSLNLPACDVLQLDVEGFEMNVLRGALATIAAYKPLIQLERFTRPEHVSFMRSLGYEVYKTFRMDVFYKFKM